MTSGEEHLAPTIMTRDRFSREQIFTSILVIVMVMIGIVTLNTWNHGNRVQLLSDPAFAQAVKDAMESPEPTYIRDMVDFKWDDVTMFLAASSVEEIDSAVGDTQIFSSSLSSNTDLFVFRYNGEIVKLLTVPSPTIVWGEYDRTLRIDAMLIQDKDSDGKVHLILTDPLAQIDVWETLPGTTQIHQGRQ